MHRVEGVSPSPPPPPPLQNRSWAYEQSWDRLISITNGLICPSNHPLITRKPYYFPTALILHEASAMKYGSQNRFMFQNSGLEELHMSNKLSLLLNVLTSARMGRQQPTQANALVY